MTALHSSLKGFLSEDTTDVSNATDATLITAKEKLYKLMEKMKQITAESVSSPITIQELKDKITTQINKIRLIERYLLTQKKLNTKSKELNNRDNTDNNIENLESNVKYKPLYDPDDFDNIESNAIFKDENDDYQIMSQTRRNSFTSIIKSIGDTLSNSTWNVWNRVKKKIFLSCFWSFVLLLLHATNSSSSASS